MGQMKIEAEAGRSRGRREQVEVAASLVRGTQYEDVEWKYPVKSKWPHVAQSGLIDVMDPFGEKKDFEEYRAKMRSRYEGNVERRLQKQREEVKEKGEVVMAEHEKINQHFELQEQKRLWNVKKEMKQKEITAKGFTSEEVDTDDEEEDNVRLPINVEKRVADSKTTTDILNEAQMKLRERTLKRLEVLKEIESLTVQKKIVPVQNDKVKNSCEAARQYSTFFACS
eukprot:GDKK01042649.1.p1 GENE.GDKK01042649.1~~GDKK01042649.1.p1  ORF type:complete len:226 (-),score=70.98 GDKK01042649.1:53-730(-)